MKKRYIFFILFIMFAASRLIRLDMLPVFADEAIYLRWATMIFHDPQQFLFLPLYDGKTPLFVWSLIPIVRSFTINPLLGGRLLVVVISLITAFVLTRIVRVLRGSRQAEIISFILSALLPLPMFFGRMSLIDVPLTLFLSLAFLYGLKWLSQRTWKNSLLAGLFWGLALLTKTSALYVIPVFSLLGLYVICRRNNRKKGLAMMQFAGGGILGLVLLFGLKVSPLFPFLFNRSSDFAFSIKEITSNPFAIIILNISRIFPWLWWYLSPILWIMVGISLFYFLFKHEKQREIFGLLLCGLVFLTPFVLSGKLLTSRYFLPLTIWIIPAFSLLLDYWIRKFRAFGVCISIALCLYCGWFLAPLYTNLNASKLTADDKRQYLSEWSAGYGIPEIRQFLIERVANGKTVLVATEGYFGTLPDGLFIYFSETRWLSRMEIIGVGQPLFGIPKELLQKAPQYNEAYLVVNRNRINFDYLSSFEVVGIYPKPNDGSPLLLLRLK